MTSMFASSSGTCSAGWGSRWRKRSRPAGAPWSMPSPVARQIQASRSTLGFALGQRQRLVGGVDGVVGSALGDVNLRRAAPRPNPRAPSRSMAVAVDGRAAQPAFGAGGVTPFPVHHAQKHVPGRRIRARLRAGLATRPLGWSAPSRAGPGLPGATGVPPSRRYRSTTRPTTGRGPPAAARRRRFLAGRPLRARRPRPSSAPSAAATRWASTVAGVNTPATARCRSRRRVGDRSW